MNKHERLGIAVFILFIFLIGFLLGQYTQKYSEISWCVDTGLKMLEKQNVSVDIDPVLIKQGVLMYKSKIDNLVTNYYKTESDKIGELA